MRWATHRLSWLDILPPPFTGEVPRRAGGGVFVSTRLSAHVLSQNSATPLVTPAKAGVHGMIYQDSRYKRRVHG